jgi:hypothetical protein
MADFRHISKALSQSNKAHKGSKSSKSIDGKVEVSYYFNFISGKMLCEERQTSQI